ncbi:MAG: ABC transporter ATP-binding protein [Clostridia bacterium]
MKLIFNYLKPFKWRLFFTSLLYAVITAVSLILPFLMSKIVDNGIAKMDMPYIYQQGIAMLIVSLLAVVSALINAKLNAHIGAYFTANLRKDVFKKVNSLSAEEFASKGTATLLTRSTEDIWMLQEASTNMVYAIVVAPMMFIGGVVMSFLSNVELALILLAITPIILTVVVLIGRKMTKLWDKADESMDMQSKVMRERLNGIRVIRSFDKEENEHQRVAGATREMSRNIIKSNILSSLINPVTQVLFNIVTVCILFVGAMNMETDASLTAGNVIATIQYVSVVIFGLLAVSFTIMFLPSVLVSAKRVQEVFNLKGIEMGESSKEVLKGSIKFNDVDFYYPDSQVASLSNISFDIAEGEIVGIIGGTGSGKTTLMKLLLNFYTPQKGEVYLGQKNMKELSRATVRDNISIALQKAMIFQGTIAENVRMGNASSSDELVQQICSIAQMNEIISIKEGGLDYTLTQAGSNLSGGQKQRISIARSILKQASVYVFDDSFSALDFLTESKLRKSLNKYLDGKTQIIITQRAATAMRCDKIIVLDQGVMVGCGNHKALLKDCEIYKEIYKSQLGGKNE